MGAKIEIGFLIDKNNRDILDAALNTLFSFGINYNEYIRGEYSYWIDGPIWKFGDSITVTEQHSSDFDGPKETDVILNILSSNFSPSITLGANWFDKVVPFILSIYESEKNWKEVKISVDRYEVIDSLNSIEREKAITKLRELFYKLGISLKPYYGIAATEIMGLVASPQDLQIDNHSLGDFNYFDRSIMLKIKMDDFMNDYVIDSLPDGCAFLYKREGIMELG